MGGRHRYIGFLKSGHDLRCVEPNEPYFTELVRQLNMIPGFGTHGVSCSGHFYQDREGGRFYPRPWGHLGLVALPESPHILTLLKLIYEQTRTDPDAWVDVNGSGPPSSLVRYNPGMDLRPYSHKLFGREILTGDGLFIVEFEIRIGDNGCLDSVPDHLCSPIRREGNDEAFQRSQQRHGEIRSFWEELRDRVIGYNQEHGFSEIDYGKSEFLPFV